MPMATGTDRLIQQLGALYLNKKFSDVTIIVEGVELPAHSLILAQRCDYFQTMFECGLIESTSKRVEIRETSVDAFKTVLKWFYTGCIQFTSLDNAFKVLRLAHMYQIMELIYEGVKYVWSKMTAKTACAILNESVLLSLDSLTEFVYKYVSRVPYSVLFDESFETLSIDALNVILTRSMKTASGVDVFQAVMRWMKANPMKSADFQNVLKNVPLTQITLKSLDSIPPEIHEHTNILAERARQLKTQKRLPHYQKVNENVSYGLLFAPKHQLLMHKIGSSKKGILVDLGRVFLLNYLKWYIVSDETNYAYWVAVSEDNVNWTRVIDRAKYPCHSTQRLCFESRYVRYIRIFGTAPEDDMIITDFQACYTTMSFEIDPETTLMERHCVEVEKLNGNVILVDGYMQPESAYVGRTYFEYDRFNHRGYGRRHFVLHIPCLITRMEILRCQWDSDPLVHSYDIEVSIDRINWTRIFCVKKDASYRGITFDKRPVKEIRLTAYTEANDVSN